MIVQIDAGALARILGHKMAPVAPGELGDLVLPVLDITPFLLAGEAPAGAGESGDAFTPVGSGRIRSIAVANPGAGVEIVINVPIGVAWEVIALRASFVASAVAATRIPRLVYNDAALREFARMPNVLQATAAQTLIITWAAGVNSRVSAGGLLEVGTDIPNRIIIGPGGRIQTTTAALQAGDTWIDITLGVREYNA